MARERDHSTVGKAFRLKHDRSAPHMTIACPDCGTLEDVPELPPRSRAHCPTCKKRLELTSGRTVTAALACALGTLLLLFPANLTPFLSVSLLGMERTTLLGSGVVWLWQAQFVILATLIFLLAVVLPFLRFGLLSAALAAIRMSHQARWVGPVFRWAIWLDQWAMPDVFLLGAFVGYSRVEANLDVKIGPGGYCFMAAAFLAMISRAVLDERTAWRAIGASPALTDPESHELNRELISCTTCDLVLPVEAEGQRCPRCRARLWARKRDSIVRTSALLIAAFILYWPANLYPMSKSLQFGETMSHRIIDGIRELFQAGLAPLGVLIFITSIAIPVLKIAGLGWCVISVQRGSSTHLVEKTKFYRVIDEVGRWSNMDPFTIAVFVPLMQFNNLISARAAPGAGAFILVVVLTMFASQSFDPRLMWDAAERAI